MRVLKRKTWWRKHRFDSCDHEYDIGFLESLVILVFNDCLLSPVLYYFLLTKNKNNESIKGRI